MRATHDLVQSSVRSNLGDSALASTFPDRLATRRPWSILLCRAMARRCLTLQHYVELYDTPKHPRPQSLKFDGPAGRIRTCDPLFPKQMRYQTALRPDKTGLSSIIPSTLRLRCPISQWYPRRIRLYCNQKLLSGGGDFHQQIHQHMHSLYINLLTESTFQFIILVCQRRIRNLPTVYQGPMRQPYSARCLGTTMTFHQAVSTCYWL